LRNTLVSANIASLARRYKGNILMIAGRIRMVTGDILDDQGDQCCDRRLAIIADVECVLIDDRRDHCYDYWRVLIVTNYVAIDVCNRDEKEEKCIVRRKCVAREIVRESRFRLEIYTPIVTAVCNTRV